MSNTHEEKEFTYMLGEKGGDWDVDLLSYDREQLKNSLRDKLYATFDLATQLARSSPIALPPIIPDPLPWWRQSGREVPYGMPPADLWIDDLNAIFAMGIVADGAVTDTSGSRLDYETFKAKIKCGAKFEVNPQKVDQLRGLGLEPNIGELLPQAMGNGVPFFDLHQRSGIKCCMYICNEWYSCFTTAVMIKSVPGDPATPWSIRVTSDAGLSKDIPMFLQATWHCIDQGPYQAERAIRRKLEKALHHIDLKTLGEREQAILEVLVPSGGSQQ